ncbi:MAG: cell division protein ZapD [Pseudomonadota bacterium]
MRKGYGMADTLVFEHPLNDRIRMMLRVEQLFLQCTADRSATNTTLSDQAALTALLELSALLGRTDIRTECVHELERYATQLVKYSARDGVDRSALTTIIDTIQTTLQPLKKQRGALPFDQLDFIQQFRAKAVVPISACAFDSPALFCWYQQPEAEKEAQRQAWLAPLLPLEAGVTLLLDLIRSSAGAHALTTSATGVYSKDFDPQHTLHQLIRVSVAPGKSAYPEISGNKYRINIRFLKPNFETGRATVLEELIPFELSCCI